MGSVVKLSFGQFSKRDLDSMEQVHSELQARGLWGRLKVWSANGSAYAAVYPPRQADTVEPMFVITREPSGVYYKSIGRRVIVAGRTIGACLHASYAVHNALRTPGKPSSEVQTQPR